MSSIEYEWDEETQQWVRKEELRLRKLKQEIISELLQQLEKEFEIEISKENV